MLEWRGWHFPDGETHLIDWMKQTGQLRDGVPQYQFHKYQAALEHVRPARQIAIDVGAHVGQWSRNMALDFRSVICFEPVPRYAECWRENMAPFTNAVLRNVALGDEEGSVDLVCETPGSHGDTRVSFTALEQGEVVAAGVKLRTLDSYTWVGRIDFIKIDCEGFEFFVLGGGEKTIREHKPCLIVEQKTGHADKFGLGTTDAVDLLESWGAMRRGETGGDYILSWD